MKYENTVIKNDTNELNPMCVQIGWQVCINNKKLKLPIRKINFPCPLSNRCLSIWIDMSPIVTQMDSSVTTKFSLLLRIRRIPCSHIPSASLYINACPLGYTIHLSYSKGVWYVFSQIRWNNSLSFLRIILYLWRFMWLASTLFRTSSHMLQWEEFDT